MGSNPQRVMYLICFAMLIFWLYKSIGFGDGRIIISVHFYSVSPMEENQILPGLFGVLHCCGIVVFNTLLSSQECVRPFGGCSFSNRTGYGVDHCSLSAGGLWMQRFFKAT